MSDMYDHSLPFLFVNMVFLIIRLLDFACSSSSLPLSFVDSWYVCCTDSDDYRAIEITAFYYHVIFWYAIY